MDFEILFSIGELAKLCSVTPKTLRFYDKLGLLKPSMVNPQNGYRFYTRWHITRVSTIKQLQEIGIALEDIHLFLGQDGTADIVDALSKMLCAQKDVIEHQIEKLAAELALLQSLQTQCETIKNKISYDDKSALLIQEIPQRKIIYIPYCGKYTPTLFQQSYQKILSAIKQYGKNTDVSLSSPLAIYDVCQYSTGMNVKVGYEVNDCTEMPFSELFIEKSLFACYTYRGPYSTLHSTVYPQKYKELRELGYTVSNPRIEYYYLNEAVTNEKNFLTEIQIPIKVTEI